MIAELLTGVILFAPNASLTGALANASPASSLLNTTLSQVETKPVSNDAEFDVALWELLPEAAPEDRLRALEQIRSKQDRRFLYPLLDLLRFTEEPQLWRALLDALGALTGESLGSNSNPWRRIRESVQAEGLQAQAPSDYLAWKTELLVQSVGPRFADLLGSDLRLHPEILSTDILWGGVDVDEILTLDDPPTITAAEAGYLGDAEPVFGALVNGVPKAYPLRILDVHELVNDRIGGVPVALSWCTLCGSGILYRADLELRIGAAGPPPPYNPKGGPEDDSAESPALERRESRVLFSTSGLLLHSNKLMYDRESESLWSQIRGEPMAGPLVNSGLSLKPLPTRLTTWSTWKSDHPDTLVLSNETGTGLKYRLGQAYGDYFSSLNTRFPGAPEGTQETSSTKAMKKERSPKERILAVEIQGHDKAYPLEELDQPVLHDTIGTQPILLLTQLDPGYALPETWQRASGVDTADQLTLALAETVLSTRPYLLREVDRKLLLAVPVGTRFFLFQQLTKNSSNTRKLMRLRDRTATEALVADVRAYAASDHRFELGAKQGQLKDERGKAWTVTEDALIGPKGERLERLRSHVLFWFAWRSYFPMGEVYEAPAASVASASTEIR